uniref:Transposase n=1 Tax=Cyprinus carpio carpio TaxID=630221 RepID=A0A9J7ZRK1_CYPCA
MSTGQVKSLSYYLDCKRRLIAEFAQEWQRVGVRASAAKKPLLSKKNIKDRQKFCRMNKDWTAEDWCKVIFSDQAPFRLFGTSGKSIVRRRKGERYNESCGLPIVKHPETIHVWGCFSTKGVGSLMILPKNTAMNKEWYQNVLRVQLLSMIHEQFGVDPCIFQHAGATCHIAVVIKKWLEDHYNE